LEDKEEFDYENNIIALHFETSSFPN